MNNNDNSYNDEQSEQSLPCTSIGPFKLVKFLGSGAFAKVYLAKHETTNEEVAIKYIKKQELFINEMSSPEALSNEINNHKMLFHNNIARIYCTIETNTTISIVTEYCSNGDLISKVIEQGKFDEVTACNIFAQIINGLEYMHSEYGLAHRDMKPENVLFDRLNEVKLCDFGLCKFYNDNNNQMQLLTTPCGSPIYAAPEMLMNKPYNGDLIDIWSAGITLYVMVAGKLPFDDENIQSLIHKITKGVFDMPSDLSSSCKDLISKLLTVDPSKRITFAEIKRHAWFNSNNVFSVRGLNIKDVLIPVDEDVVIELVEEGFGSVDSIVRSIIMNNHDELTVGYYLRVKKKIREGGKSVSDLANKDGMFMEYVMREDSKWEYYDWEEDEVVGKIMERIHKKMVIEENKRAEFMDVPDFSGGKMERENDIVVNVDVLDEEINEDVHNISKRSEHNNNNNNNNNNVDKENHNDNNIKHLQQSSNNKETISTNNNINETTTQTEQKTNTNTNNNNNNKLVTESKKTKNTKQPKDSQFLSKKKQPPTSTKPSKSKPLSKKKELTISTHLPSFKDKPKQTTTSKNMTISSYRDKPSINNHKHILTKPTKTLPNSQSTTNLSHLKTRLTNTISSSHQKQPKVNKIPNIKNSLLTKTSKQQQQPTTSKGRNINLTINTNNNSTRVSGALPPHQKISSTTRVSTETKQTNAVAVVQTTQPKQNESSFAKFKKIAINTNKDKARYVNNGYNKNIRLKQRTKENENSINNTNTNEHSISDISSSIIRNKHIKKINILNTSVIKAHNNSSRLDSSTINAVNTNNKHNNSSNNNSKRHSVKSSNPESLKRKIVPKTARHVQYKNTINHHEKSKTKTSGVMSHSFSQKTLCNTFKNNNEHNLSIVQEVPQLIRNKKKTQSNISNVIVTKKDMGSVQKELAVLFGSQNVEMNKDKKCFVCKSNNSNGSKISFVLEVEEVVKNKNKSLKLTAVVNEGGDVNLGKIVMKIKKKLAS
jgi:serine/threonine protein kinase